MRYTIISVRKYKRLMIQWKDLIRYLGMDLCNARKFEISLSSAKRRFNVAANCIIGRLENRASEEVTLQLIKSKCLPIILYGTEACALTKAQRQSLDFIVTRVGMKIFRSSNRALVVERLSHFGLMLPSALIDIRVEKFKREISSMDCVLFKGLF